MKNKSILLLSFFVALVTSVLFYLFFSASHVVVKTSVFAVSGMFFVMSFLACFIISQFVISKKLKQILFHLKQYKNEKISQNNSLDLLEELDAEVDNWAAERKSEVEQLKKLENYRKEFLGNVSHELKTPIFNIQGYVLTLLDGGIDDPKINKDYLKRAEKSVDRMISIIDDLQAISQLETGELEIELERFDIVALINDIIESQEMKATAKGIILTLKDSNTPIFVMADRFRIRQVLTNLIVNSVKYGKEYGETRIKCSDAGENVYIEIADNGIGIAKEHIPRLFERFYRVDKHRSREQGGTGLGLAIVKHIIEAHNQTISVMSTEGAGSVFSFTLKKG